MSGSIWRSLHGLVSRLFPASYRWPAQDIRLDGRLLHLVGSIHMGTRDMQPLPARLLRQLQKADALIVEADITQGGSPFDTAEEREPLSVRLTPDEQTRLTALCNELHLSLSMFDTLPAWQIALMLQAQQAQRLGLRPDYGIDYQLLQAAKTLNKPIIELEGADTQIALLKSLPDDGMALLQDTLTHWHTNARLLQLMVSWWLDAPPREPHIALPSTFSSALNDTLISQRNALWRDRLRALPSGHYVVAVGALHLYGEENLLMLLQR
ncbi:conjugal transfer protein TraB [Candidatus Pantoea deserta]|uniref:Conjugal transfer protein TraB n=1 Tax=Candidatus Pantoea deserta TaxID=1869313 RepID=A0A3N4PGK9_9GAMM|nr:TraB/GumN family protein [Pantoea deserta]RPE03627.1 conjugal transfer protein TraB [Pantoea deserta]